jgi:16S rRNA (adenine1518-N6/adenine1519-N6)-dimethyltransferase
VIASPGEVLRRYGLSARKSWGQHFLVSPSVHDAIVRASEAAPGRRVVEIGAGLGTLTAQLLATGAEVWAIERDRDLCEVLRRELAEAPNLRLVEADAVAFDYGSAADDAHPRPVVVGNLPYQLTGPLLFALLEHHDRTGPWVVMVQAEVAQRLAAAPGSKTYGGVTIAIGRLRSVTPVVRVPPGAFLPPPKVDSAVIRLDPRPEPRGVPVEDRRFLALVRTAFQQRRKTIANALSPLGPRDDIRHWCEAAGVDPSMRPERLTIEQFTMLARARDGE